MSEDFVRAIVGLPKFLFQYVVGLVIYVLTDYNLFTMLLVGVVAALLTSILVGVLSFFVLYTVSRIISHGFAQVGEAIAYHARLQAPSPPPGGPAFGSDADL